MTADQELSLGVYWRVVIARWRWVCAIVFVAVAASVAIALLTTPIYRATVLIIPTGSSQSSSGLSNLLNQYSNLASVAGLNASPENGPKAIALATFKSRAFTEQFVAEQNLLPLLFPKKWNAATNSWRVPSGEIPTVRDGARRFMDDVRRISVDKETGLITITVDWRDKKQATDWGNLLGRRVNEVLRKQAIDDAQRSLSYLNQELERTNAIEIKQAIYHLVETQINQIMLANVREEFAFKVVDPATALDEQDRIKPRRVLTVVVGGFLGLFWGVVVAIVREGAAKRRAARPESA